MNRPYGTGQSAGWIGLVLGIGVLAGGSAVSAQQMAEIAIGASASAPASNSVVDLSSGAREAALSHLELLRKYVHASRLRDPDRRKEEYLKARQDLTAAAYFPKLTPQEVESFATLWPALVAHYVDGFRTDQMVVQATDKEATATVVAVNPQDQATVEAVRAEIRQNLEKQGLSEQDLKSREQVLLKRELANRGIGWPLAATIQLYMAKVDRQWRLQRVHLVPPAGAATRPVVGPVPQAPATGRAAQDGQ